MAKRVVARLSAGSLIANEVAAITNRKQLTSLLVLFDICTALTTDASQVL
jgi:hypothetical protein